MERKGAGQAQQPSAKAQQAPASPPPARPDDPPVDAATPQALRSLGYVDAEADTAWPFGLSPAMSSERACRRLRETTGAACSPATDRIEVTLSPPQGVERGPHHRRRATRLVLHFERNELARVEMWLEADGDDEKVTLQRVP